MKPSWRLSGTAPTWSCKFKRSTAWIGKKPKPELIYGQTGGDFQALVHGEEGYLTHCIRRHIGDDESDMRSIKDGLYAVASNGTPRERPVSEPSGLRAGNPSSNARTDQSALDGSERVIRSGGTFEINAFGSAVAARVRVTLSQIRKLTNSTTIVRLSATQPIARKRERLRSGLDPWC